MQGASIAGTIGGVGGGRWLVLGGVRGGVGAKQLGGRAMVIIF